MSENGSAELSPLVSHEQLENAFWHGLRMFVGRGKRHSADEVSRGAGVHRRTLDCYRGYQPGHPDWRPMDWAQKFSIASFIGADLTSELLRFMGQEAVMLPDELDGDLDTAGLDAGEAQQAILKARHPNSPGGTDIVPEERGKIVPLLRQAVASGRRAVG